MLEHDQIVKTSQEVFNSAEYEVLPKFDHSNSFDFLAIKKANRNLRIMIKVVLDLDLFKRHHSLQIQLISGLISAFPMLIGYYGNGNKLKNNTIYHRHGIPGISPYSLKKLILEKIPFVRFSNRGGIFVNISSIALMKSRKNRNIKIDELSKLTGLSRNTIYRYEKGIASPREENFKKINDILSETKLTEPLDIFNSKKDFEKLDTGINKFEKPYSNVQKEISECFQEKQINIYWFKSEPFDGLVSNVFDRIEKDYKKQTTIITGVASKEPEINNKRIKMLLNFSSFLHERGIWIFDDENQQTESIAKTNGLKSLSISDIEKMSTKKLIREFTDKK